MQRHKPIKLTIPSMMLEEIEKMKGKIEVYVYIIDLILYRMSWDRRCKETGYVNLDKKKIDLVIGCKCDNYIKNLINNELLDRKLINNRIYHYRIHPKYKSYNEVTYFELTPETTLFKNLLKQKRNEKANYNKLEPHLYKMNREFMNIGFDTENALNYVNTIEDKARQSSYISAIYRISDKRHRYFRRNTTNNRLDTNITNLPSDLRQFIKGEYVNIDVANSQPFILCVILEIIFRVINYFTLNNLEINLDGMKKYKSRNTNIPLYTNFFFLEFVKTFGIKVVKAIAKIHKNQKETFFMNFSLFKQWILDGVLYDEFLKIVNKEFLRAEVKEMVLKVLYSRNVSYNSFKSFIPYEKEKRIFANTFPLVYEVIKILKEKDHRALAIYLQKIESNLFIDKIAKELVENDIVPITIHDSVLVQVDQKDKALSIMKSIFEIETGMIPSFHIKPP